MGLKCLALSACGGIEKLLAKVLEENASRIMEEANDPVLTPADGWRGDV